MAEAAIVVPVLILASMLMIRVFVFYIEILTTGIREHREALAEQASYKGASIKTHNETAEIKLLKGGLLQMDAGKRLKVRTYLINEDFLVRSSEIAE